MRYLALIPLALMLAGCPTISAKIDDLTGTTLDERCDTRRAAVAAWDALAAAGNELSDAQSATRLRYQIFIDAVCPPVTPEP